MGLGGLMRILPALWFLQSRSWANQVKVRFRRLRQPKYLIGALVGIGYLGMSFLPALMGMMNAGRHTPHQPIQAPNFSLWQGVTEIGLLLWLSFNWILPSTSSPALQFSEAELAFLLPAPIGRRTLLQYKLVRTLVPLAFTALTFAVISFVFRGFGGSSARSPFLIRFAGWWIVMTFLHLHATAAAFTMTRLMDRGVTPWWRRLAILVSALAVVGFSLFWMVRNSPELVLTKENFAEEPLRWIQGVLATPPLHWIILPIHWVTGPRFSHDFLEFMTRLPMALVVLAAHYLWVIRTEVAFEEASLEAARKRTEIISALRAGKHPLALGKQRKINSPFRLAPTGFPPIALLWKNLIAAGSGFRPRIFVFITLSVSVSGALLVNGLGHDSSLPVVFFGLTLGLLGMSMLMGPQMARFDFRQDLQMVDLVKLYPLPGWQIVLGEMLAPVVVLTAIQWVLLALATVLSLGSQVSETFHTPMEVWEHLLIAVAAGIIMPGFNLIGLVVPNALTLFFPAWIQIGKEGPAGLEVMGQRMIMTFGGMILIAVGLIPASLVLGLCCWLSSLFLTWQIGVAIGAVAALAVLIAEGALAISLLGKTFEKLDLT
jgi:hypothetical protein